MNGAIISNGIYRFDQINIKLAKSGDKAAFTTLIDCHRQPLYRVAVGILKSDFDAADPYRKPLFQHIKILGA